MKKVVHIHIGKCAGGSINLGLHKLGIDFEELHCGDSDSILLKRMASDKGDNLYIVCLREPIARAISSFNWDKYEKIITQKSENPIWNSLYDRFENIESLVVGYNSDDEELRELAKIAFEESRLHLHLGLAWYISPEVAISLPPKRTAVLRTEYLDEDFKVMLSNHFPSKVYSGTLPKDKDNKNFLSLSNIPKPKYLSDSSIENLKEILREDYKVLEILYKRGMLPVEY
jgi:hypothetical protein